MEFDMVYKKGNIGRSTLVKKANESMKIFNTICVGMIFGFFLGLLTPTLLSTKLNITSAHFSIIGDKGTNNSSQNNTNSKVVMDISKIWVPSNPKGAERLPPSIVASESDLYLRRLWGKPSEDLTNKPKYLVTFTVGKDQMKNIDAAVKKFSGNFTILLFHYDGKTSEWDEFEWSKRAIHVSARKQTKWWYTKRFLHPDIVNQFYATGLNFVWYAKRFLHPDIVNQFDATGLHFVWYAKRFLHPDIIAPYDYIFIWDEDLGVEHFDAEEYIKLVRKYGLEISQPGLEPNRGTTWQMTKRRGGRDVHKETEERPGWCSDSRLPPCAAFVEIMAPVFSRDAWRCVWHMIQNDLVHGWGLDFALQRCVEPAHERIGVVDAQWIVHQTLPSLGNQGQAENGKAPWQGVRLRCKQEWEMFIKRMENAEKIYYKSIGVDPSNFTAHT